MGKLKIITTPVFKSNKAAGEKTVINIGGARSSKSHSIAQLLIMKAVNEQNKNIGITRKTMPALRRTAERLVLDLLKEYGLYNAAFHNKRDNYYEMNGNRISFFSLDDPEKIKSAEFNYIWMEEANEFDYPDYITLLTRLSGKVRGKESNHIYMTLNPTDVHGWIPAKVMQREGVKVIKSTYKDNPFIQKEYIDVLESLKREDENYYKIYALGEWGSLNNSVYNNYEFIDAMPENAEEVVWGIDFGFNNPSAIVEVRFSDGEVYVKEHLYASGLINADIIKKLISLIPPQMTAQPIYADCAEPDRIKEIAREGFNIHPALKSVVHGIETVKAHRLFITKDSVNLIKEIQNYRWKTTADDTVIDDPVKFNDHALDALRYAVHTYKNSVSAKADISFI